jgi:DNA-binding Lrp family transcriptional regulator
MSDRGGDNAITEFDRRLLELIQHGVPLVREPFALIAEQLDCSRQAVLDRITALRGEDGLIREIAGIFDAVTLGYTQALIAFRVAKEGLNEAGALVAAHPGVSHCYARTGDYNLWFTLAISPRSEFGLYRTAEVLAASCGPADYLVLPMLKRYKLDVRPALGRRHDPEPAPVQQVDETHRSRHALPTDRQRLALQALQLDLPACEDPFAGPAEAVGLSPDDLLVHAADLAAAGWMRRYAAVIHHRAAGVRANVMVVWQAAGAAADAAGAVCAQIEQVSHCYLRAKGRDWPYNFYTMIHGRQREQCTKVIEEVAATTPLGPRVELWTEREFKKQRIKLFSGEEAAWEGAHARE